MCTFSETESKWEVVDVRFNDVHIKVYIHFDVYKTSSMFIYTHMKTCVWFCSCDHVVLWDISIILECFAAKVLMQFYWTFGFVGYYTLGEFGMVY